MNEYVKMGHKQCPVCLELHTREGEILIDKQLKDIPNNFEDKVVTGISLCEKHHKLFQQGYIAFVEVKNSSETGSKLNRQDAEYTGKIAHVRTTVLDKILDITEEEILEISERPMIYVSEGTIDKIQKVIPNH